MADERIPSEEELRQALGQLAVSDVLLQSLTLGVSLGYARLAPETRDLGQVRLAIEALRVLVPVLREGGVDETIARDLEQARANLQLAYAGTVSEQPTAEGRMSEPDDGEPGDREPADAGSADEVEQSVPEDHSAGEESRPADADP